MSKGVFAKRLSIVLMVLFAITLTLVSRTLAANPGFTTRVSVDSDGNQGKYTSISPSISGNGRHIAFTSVATNLVPGDTNGTSDIFVHDWRSGVTERVSVDNNGNQSNSFSTSSAISSRGRFVAFQSNATNLVPGDTNGAVDIFVYDRQSGTTERVSVASDGNQGNAASTIPAISNDGRFVAFNSVATNLVPGDTNVTFDVFVHDRQSGVTERVSVASNGNQGNASSVFPAISGDGRFVAFNSVATNLVPGDTNRVVDIFVHDRQSGATERVSVDSSGKQGNAISSFAAVSDNGRFVAFTSHASNLVTGDTNSSGDVFVHDRRTGATERVSVDSRGNQGITDSFFPAISGKGRFVAFISGASNLVSADTKGVVDVFVHDRRDGVTELVSRDSSGNQGGNALSGKAAINDNGRFVAFTSSATNLVAGDTNGTSDVFVTCRTSCRLMAVGIELAGTITDGWDYRLTFPWGLRIITTD